MAVLSDIHASKPREKRSTWAVEGEDDTVNPLGALDRLIAGICAEYERPAAQKGLSLEHNLGSIRLVGDAVAVGRIVRNLIDNAIKYTDQGEVRVATHIERLGAAPLAVVTVTDTGKGIPATEQSRIFEEFYQLDNPGRDRSSGVGLGLAIVQRLCELIGATVSVESAVGQGTCFRVSMPAILSKRPIKYFRTVPTISSQS